MSSPRSINYESTTRIATLVVLAAITLLGCEQSTQPRRIRRTASAGGQPSTQQFTRAMDYVARLEEFEQGQATTQVAYNLNRWIETVEIEKDWTPDPLTKRLPREIRNSLIAQDFDRLQVNVEDVQTLLEASWLHDIAERASKREISSPIAEMATLGNEGLEDFEQEQLTVAMRLFDWTVRNIQLEETLPFPEDPVAAPSADGTMSARQASPPKRGIPGPGYQHFPHQVLVYGRGDALERARIFILLARQQEIDVVMLAFPGRTTPPRPRPWLPAVLIGDQLYLFDIELGLPIPGPDGGIATLEEVLDDPKLLSDLDVGTDFTYRRLPTRGGILALVDASPEATALRMQIIERGMSAENRFVLTTRPTELAERLKKCKGIEDVTIWRVPYETIWYQQAFAARIQSQEETALREYMSRYQVFDMPTSVSPLVRGRQLHFRGRFEGDDDNKGAKQLYMESRLPNAKIEQIATSREMQKELGILGNEPEQEYIFRNKIITVTMMVEQSKFNASYWLGLAQYDTDRLDAAKEWFDGRTLKAAPDGPWTFGARYNLGRTYEAQGKIEDARALHLQESDSPQQHGNLLRARLLGRALRDSSDSAESDAS